MKRLLFTFGFLFLLINSVIAQNQFNTVPPLNGGNGSLGITFNVTADQQSIIVDTLYCTFSATGTTEIWYKPTPITGAPNITTANGWTQLTSSATVTQNANGDGSISPINYELNLLIPAGQTYAFYIDGTNAGLRYTTGPSGGNPQPFSDGFITIETGIAGYGGARPTPINHPRQFNGGIKYKVMGGTDDAATVSVDSISAVCPGNHDVYATIANYGTNQINSVDVHWSVNGAVQPVVSYTQLLDTFNNVANNPTSASILLGNVALTAGANDIEIYTDNPNGNVDTTNYNDTIITSIETSPPPTGLTILGVSSETADVGVSGTTGGTIDYEYGAPGFTQGTGTSGSASASPFTIPGLSPNTDYAVYVRNNCGGGNQSTWVGPVTFTTLCAPETAPWTYDVESATPTTSSDIQDCWSSNPSNTSFVYEWNVTDDGTTPSTNTGASSAHSGSQYFYTEASSGSQGDVAELTTPLIDISGLTNPAIEFYYYMYGAEIDKLITSVSNDHGVTWTNIDTISGEQQTSDSEPWRLQILNLTGYTDTILVRFSATAGSSFHGDISLDDISVKEGPSCYPTTNISASNLTTNSADLSWTENGGASEWQVEYDTTGFVQGAGNIVSGINSNPYTLNGLSPNTEYDYYVRAVCGAGDSSSWTGPYTFRTPCTAYSANGFWEDFEESSESLPCWIIKDANADGDTWEVYDFATYANSGTRSARIHTDFNNGANDDYLISPAIIMTGAESLKFSYRVQSSTEPNDFEVLVSTTGTDPADFTDTIMHDTSYSNTDYKDTVVDLSSYTGTIYIAFHVPQGGLDGYYLYIDDVRFGECIPTPGTDGATDACQTGGNVDLPSIIQTNNNYGTWEFPANPSVLQNGSEFNVSTLAGGAYDVMYVVQGLCAGEADTTIATVNVYPPSSAGTNGTVTVCKNEPINLIGALQGNVDLGGTWYDPSNQPITGSKPNAGTIPGSFNYFYIVSNAACPADTALVNVIVDGTCDYTGLANEAFNQLSVFPNPTSNKINIVNPTNEENLKIVVLDMNGRVVLRDNKSLSNNEKTTLSLSKLDKGIYTLKVSNAKGQKVFKIVKQ